MSNTKIVVTLGPACDSPDVLRQMLAHGVSIFRMNASHGTQDEHAARISKVRSVAAEQGKPAALLLDLQGPKIRLGRFETESCALSAGVDFTITTDKVFSVAGDSRELAIILIHVGFH